MVRVRVSGHAFAAVVIVVLECFAAVCYTRIVPKVSIHIRLIVNT